MVTIYEIGSDSCWTGNSRQAPDDQVPSGWTRSAPPELQAGEKAKMTNSGWVVIEA